MSAVCKIMTKLIRVKKTGYGSLQMALLDEFKQSEIKMTKCKSIN